MSDTYLTIETRCRSEIKVIGSKFIGTIQPVQSVEEAESFLTEMRKEFWDASHNCYGFQIIGTDLRFSDDGEPNGTAGKPIFDLIKGNQLYYTMIVVTRYFGGTKLGTGGLIRAYGDSANNVLQHANIIEVIRKHRLKITHSYDDTSIAMRFINSHNAQITDTRYSHVVTLTIEVPQSETEHFIKALHDSSNGRVSAQRI